MAIGCLWSTSWLGADVVEAAVKTPQAISLYLTSKRLASSTSMVPPRIVAVQLHLATVSTLSIRTKLFLTLPFFPQTHFLLGLHRYSAAWLAYGNAGRLILLLGLHQRSPPGTDAAIDQKRRKCFWSAFMMDRFLSLVLGLPFFFNERDMTTPYPENGAVLTPHSAVGGAPDQEKMLVGSVAHFKFVVLRPQYFR
jgi:hypothetical protein